MSTTDQPASEAAKSAGEQDLGPLAWVQDELRKSLDGAVKAVRRFVREAEEAGPSDLAALDSSPLRMAKQQLHQAGGALEMVGMEQPALLLRAMEAAVQRYVQTPADCGDAAVQTLEKASFALLEFLETRLAGKRISAVALFPQYRDVQTLTGNQGKVHPADLWPVERRMREPLVEHVVPAMAYGPQARGLLDQTVLQVVKTADRPSSARLRELCLGLAEGHTEVPMRTFWKVAAGFFDALAHGLLKPDLYTKRVASRVLMQYSALAKGEPGAPERLLQDMLFFCAYAGAAPGAQSADVLQAIYRGFGLQRHEPVDYEQTRFGRFDPALLTQARKRIAVATETWSSLAGGDKGKIKSAVDQFSLVCESLNKLHPASQRLSQTLMQVMHSLAQQGQAPAPAVAMEVATAVLYLQAAFASLDLADEAMAGHAAELAQRLDRVLAGQDSQPLEAWMEQLYRQVSDQQTMGSVVGELRITLGETEKLLDQYFRHPEDRSGLTAVSVHLSQMRGVLSVLGLDQASLALARMRQNVDLLQIGEMPVEERQPLFDKLGNSLGALGFLIDMLSYQRNMARKLYVFDEEAGELRLLMGRNRARATDRQEVASPEVQQARAPQPLPATIPRDSVVDLPLDSALEPLAEMPAGQPESLSVPAVAPPAAPAPEPAAPAISAAQPAGLALSEAEDTDEELRGIFLEEAGEVVGNGLAAIQALNQEPGNLSEQTTLRRAFHTLKGSSRMVSLDDFGEAGWAMEQMLNAWLAEHKPMPEGMRQLVQQAMEGFGEWTTAIAEQRADGWQSAPFRASADAMRIDGRLLPLDMAAVRGLAAEAQPISAVAAPVAAVDAAQLLAASDLELAGSVDAQPTAPAEAIEPLDAAAASEPVPAAEELDFSAWQAALDSAPQMDAAEEQPAPAAAAPLDGLSLDLDAWSAEPEPASAQTPAAKDLELDLAQLTAAPEALPAQAETRTDRDGAEPLDAQPTPLEVEAAAVPEPVPEPVVEAGTAAGLPEELAEELIEAARPALEAPELEPVQEAVPEPSPEPSPEPILEPAPEALLEAAPELALDPEPAPEPVPEPAPEPALEVTAEAASPQNQLIGELSISMPLYNVYLGEAEEWSQRLQDALSDWQQHLHQAQPEAVFGLAHSLAGSSATVGFKPLSELARLLEHALAHVQPQPVGSAEQVAVFVQAAEEIRGLLHQFAAGFLRYPQPDLLTRLQAIVDQELAAPAPDQRPADAPPATAQELQLQLDAAISRAMALEAADDDDIDVFDIIDPDLFPIFEEEAVELMPALGSALRTWAAQPERLDARSSLLRALHTLKGSSRLAGALRLGEMAHRLESAVEALGTETLGSEALGSELIEPLFHRLDAMEACLNVLRAVGAQAEAEALNPPAMPDSAEPRSTAVPDQPVEPATEALPASGLAPLPPALAPVLPVASTARVAAQQTVRVRSQLLDRLINEAGEVMIARSRLDARMERIRGSLGDLSGNLERLRLQLRDIEVQAESQMQSRLALSKEAGADFDPLEFDRFTRVQELTRMMAESVNDVATVQRNLQRDVAGAEDDLVAQARQARDLQRDLLRTRMVEFDSISERLYAVVRVTSKDTGKQVKLGLAGGTIEMDRGVLERMVPAFEHLLRNCVGHGIELPGEREAAGKPATGSIQILVQQEGNDVAVSFEDDGAGLDIARIRARALAQSLIAEAESVDAERAAELIFMPGFTTAAEVTGLSGRGIGMDVVRTEVQALGGRIETQTQPGQGSRFRLVLPLTTAVTQVVMLRAGELSVGVPASLVQTVRRVNLADLEAAYRSGELVDGAESIPFYWAGAVWQHSPRSVETAQGKTRPVVIFRSAAQRIALHVDEVLGHQEVVVKNLGPQLSRLPGLTGMSVLASGAVVLIYNPVALSTVYSEQIRALGVGLPALLDEQAAREQRAQEGRLPGGGQVPLVLVVDDSITVRRVTQRLLQREGYRVVVAADGLQALEKLQDEQPVVVLSDIEMPRMDGFDLARNIRGDARLKHLPIIMITSRIAQKHRDHARELGVNHYLGKPYSDEELMGLVHHYATGRAMPELRNAVLEE